MRRTLLQKRLLSVPDIIILMLIATGIYALVVIAAQWRADFTPVAEIDLSIRQLPRYVVLSAIRGITAYFISLLFTLVVGYAAAKSRRAEQVILPLLDILQSIPVLGFLPALVLGLVALFPGSNIGLELAAILMIFTGQVWNMTFAFYASVKNVPRDLADAASVMGLSPWQKLKQIELPVSAVPLGWNSLMSMAGGWFFLSVCEAFSLGESHFRLPGIGSYMALAIHEGNGRAIGWGIFAMAMLIVVMDFVIWRPIISWIQRFRIEDVDIGTVDEPLMKIFIRESRIVRWLKLNLRRYRTHHRQRRWLAEQARQEAPLEPIQARVKRVKAAFRRPAVAQFAETVGTAILFATILWGAWKLARFLGNLSPWVWLELFRDAFYTLARVTGAVVLSTLWTVPFGIWIGTSQRRTRIAQPIVQVLASFPAPMLYPLALALFVALRIGFEVGSMFLMFLGVQWYVLFNVLAGALRIPRELDYALSLMNVSRLERWKRLYLPSVFPDLVTGWLTAAGGAWNASIVAEYVVFRGEIWRSQGIGSTISMAAAAGDLHLLAASLTLMVVLVVLINRTVWSRLYQLAETRYRLEI